MFENIALFWLFLSEIPNVTSNIFRTMTNDDRHDVNPQVRNSSNPLGLPLFSSRPSSLQSGHPTRIKSIPTKLPSKHDSMKHEQRSSSPTTYDRQSLRSNIHGSTRPVILFGPTTSPSNRPTSGSSKCQSTAGGFGQVTSSALTVIYNYKMELSEANPMAVLPTLESAVSDALIASFFTDCKSDVSNFNTSKSIFSSTLSTQLLGLSSSPPDVLQSSKSVT